MIEPGPQQWALPLRFERAGGRVRTVTNPQGSMPEIADCVETILRYRQGERLSLPGFGIPRFEGEIDAEFAATAARAAIDDHEPRAQPIVEGDWDPTDPAVMRLRAMYQLNVEADD